MHIGIFTKIEHVWDRKEFSQQIGKGRNYTDVSEPDAIKLKIISKRSAKNPMQLKKKCLTPYK